MNGPAKDLVMSGIAAAEALKEKKSVQNIVKEGLLFTIHTITFRGVHK